GPGLVGAVDGRSGAAERRRRSRGHPGARAGGGRAPMSEQPGSGNGFDASAPSNGGHHAPAPSLEVDLNGLRFPTPVLAASGCFNVGRELAGIVDLKRVGGLVTKSVTLAPRRGLPVPRMAETASGMLNAIGLQNVGVDEFRAKDAPWIESLRDAGTP